MQCSATHRGLYLGNRHTWHTDAQRVVISGIEHIHQVGTDSSRRIDHAVLLREVALDEVAITILHLDITFQGEITRASGYGLVESVRKIHLLASDEYLGGLGGIHSSHHDAGRELVASHYGLGIGNDKGIQGIDAFRALTRISFTSILETSVWSTAPSA